MPDFVAVIIGIAAVVSALSPDFSALEPPRKSRRLFGLSHAARADSSSSCR